MQTRYSGMFVSAVLVGGSTNRTEQWNVEEASAELAKPSSSFALPSPAR
jgi:hypothetical protein